MTHHMIHLSVERKIYYIRGKRVMLDTDLAQLYQVTTGALNQAVRRNSERFPDDFVFRLDNKEYKILKSQIVISRWGGRRRSQPLAFTQEGISMLSGVLKSPRAVQANIQIMRTFVKLREMIATNDLIRQKIEELERKFDKHEKQFKVVFDAIRDLLEPAEPPRSFQSSWASESGAGSAGDSPSDGPSSGSPSR